jgi:hypothetical protein
MSIEDIKNRVLKKYSVKKNNTQKGFWFFFGLGNNPYEKAVDDIYHKSVRQALKEDWKSVTGDFSRVFTKESEKLDV